MSLPFRFTKIKIVLPKWICIVDTRVHSLLRVTSTHDCSRKLAPKNTNLSWSRFFELIVKFSSS